MSKLEVNDFVFVFKTLLIEWTQGHPQLFFKFYEILSTCYDIISN